MIGWVWKVGVADICSKLGLLHNAIGVCEPKLVALAVMISHRQTDIAILTRLLILDKNIYTLWVRDATFSLLRTLFRTQYTLSLHFEEMGMKALLYEKFQSVIRLKIRSISCLTTDAMSVTASVFNTVSITGLITAQKQKKWMMLLDICI